MLEGAPLRAVGRGLEAARAELGGQGEAEVLLKRSVGATLRVVRGSEPESGSWIETALAVRVVLPDGRAALVSTTGWGDAEGLAREAVSRARGAPPGAGRAPAAPCARLAGPCGAPDERPVSVARLATVLESLESASRSADPLVSALDHALVRGADVDGYLATTGGTALHHRQRAAQVHAAVVARDGLRVAVASDGWAGPGVDDDDARRLGARLGRLAAAHVAGVSAVPARGLRVLLSPAVVGEITHALAPGLLGLEPAITPPPGAFSERLRLAEDAAEDGASRWPAVDGEGRPLRVLGVVREGHWVPPGPEVAPSVRPGVADVPRPGWLRLTWTWRDGVTDERLRGELGTGLLLEEARAHEVDVASLTWRGTVSGAWIEAGRERHGVVRVPWTVNLWELLARVEQGGGRPVAAHASGTIRSVPLLVDDVRVGA